MGGLTEMPKVGDELRYVGAEYSFMTVGKTYKVTEVDGDSFYYVDDHGDALNDYSSEFHEWELVGESEGPVEDIDLSASYPKYFKDVSDIDSIDVYKTHDLFDIDDPSGAIQHASKKLLLSGARTGGKSKYTDIKEARDTLNRWLEINAMEAEASE